MTAREHEVSHFNDPRKAPFGTSKTIRSQAALLALWRTDQPRWHRRASFNPANGVRRRRHPAERAHRHDGAWVFEHACRMGVEGIVVAASS
jgi:hypothetical protein